MIKWENLVDLKENLSPNLHRFSNNIPEFPQFLLDSSRLNYLWNTVVFVGHLVCFWSHWLIFLLIDIFIYLFFSSLLKEWFKIKTSLYQLKKIKNFKTIAFYLLNCRKIIDFLIVTIKRSWPKDLPYKKKFVPLNRFLVLTRSPYVLHSLDISLSTTITIMN